MIKKSLGFLLAISLAMNVFFLAKMEFPSSRTSLVKQPEAPGGCPISEGDHHLYQALGLSSHQLEKVQPLALIFHDRLQRLQQEMETARTHLVRLLAQDSVDHSQAEELRKQMAAVQDQIQKEVISHLLELKEILTPGQRERFFSLLEMTTAASP